MRCASCGADNREGRRFCGGCGGALALLCAGCGFENEPSDRFCGGCGEGLGAVAATAPGGSPAGAARRRQVTVLFADLVGYTSMSARLDPEEIGALLARFFEGVDSAVLAFGGSIDKHIGDNVMGVFGAPVAHDDDPERAVRASVEIHRLVEALGAEEPLQVSIGIAAGEVLASPMGSRHHQAYTVTGDAVNLASRLQGVAAPDRPSSRTRCGRPPRRCAPTRTSVPSRSRAWSGRSEPGDWRVCAASG